MVLVVLRRDVDLTLLSIEGDQESRRHGEFKYGPVFLFSKGVLLIYASDRPRHVFSCLY